MATRRRSLGELASQRQATPHSRGTTQLPSESNTGSRESPASGARRGVSEDWEGFENHRSRRPSRNGSIRESHQDLISTTQPMPAWATPGATAFITPRGMASAMPVPPALQHLYPGYPPPGPTLLVMGIIELNPLLLPPPHPSPGPSLSWNMLFPPPRDRRFRGDPATWPPVQTLRLVSQRFPWKIDITATNIERGVTCDDVIKTIHRSMRENVAHWEFNSAPPDRQTEMTRAFRYNRSSAVYVPQDGDKLPNVLLRCDSLDQYTAFGGIVQDKRYVKKVCALAEVPGTFELLCIKPFIVN
ncbi:hypothetical protein NLI96_g12192 [Meripilus lineatus]|uniref:DUF6699 domain-containing protein n=1 Tax=Meripilus lineatus TaxID=2056292 RepID=A0AAD5UST8_9APHY|nr:hypothetical protein NLI96_g12192 [Physisporinus lineatus]